MKPSSQKYAEWERAISQVRLGMAKSEVEKLLGTPVRVISPGPIEIVSYQDERIGNTLHGIRVAFTDGTVSQCYLGLELCEPEPAAPTRRRSQHFQLFLVVLVAIVVILLYGWLSTR